MTFPALPAPTWEGLVALPEVALFVRQYGQSGPAVVVIHGGPDWDHTYFLPYLLPLAERLRLIFFDMRGCGRSQKFHAVAPYHIDRVVADLAALLDHLAVEDVTLLGFSYGGRVALRFVDQHPQRVAKLILASTTAYEAYQDALDQKPLYQQRNDAALRQQVAALLQSATVPDEEKTRQLALLTCPLDIFDLSRLAEVRQVLERLQFSGEWMAAWQAGTLRAQHTEYAERLRTLALPVLILHGEQDLRFPVEVAQRLYANVPQSVLQVLAECGHLAHIEQTEAWNRAVYQFAAPMDS
jgi:proline-specific peptidase